MFKKNETHRQGQLFGVAMHLNAEKQKRLANSMGGYFYRHIFCNIVEEDFSVLYSDKHSAPNAPINCMVSALLLQQKHGWTYAELFEQIDFNIEVRYALGLRDLDSVPFTEPTLFNFKRRLAKHRSLVGECLVEKQFNRLTKQQLSEAEIKTAIQRTDSLLLNSNIRSYGRVALIVEVLLRFYGSLSEADQQEYGEVLSAYIGKKADTYIRHIKPGEQMTHLQKLGEAYRLLYSNLADSYQNESAFKLFARVYTEHFEVIENEPKVCVIQPKPNEALHSRCLQSPDDIEATFRNKRGEQYQGYVAMVTETCHPDNALQLITDVHTAVNTTDDTQLLQDRLNHLKQKTPDLAELHQDGGFGNDQNDLTCQELDITPIQTAIKGCLPKTPIAIEYHATTHTYTAQCANPQHPQVTATNPSKNYKAQFDLRICATCPFQDTCPTKVCRKYEKGVAIYKFKPQDYLRQQRHKNLTQLPPERQKLRPNVEATMAQMRAGENRKGKLKVRGLINTCLYCITMAIMINFGRVMRYKKAIFDQIHLSFLLQRPQCRVCRLLKALLTNSLTQTSLQQQPLYSIS